MNGRGDGLGWVGLSGVNVMSEEAVGDEVAGCGRAAVVGGPAMQWPPSLHTFLKQPPTFAAVAPGIVPHHHSDSSPPHPPTREHLTINIKPFLMKQLCIPLHGLKAALPQTPPYQGP